MLVLTLMCTVPHAAPRKWLVFQDDDIPTAFQGAQESLMRLSLILPARMATSNWALTLKLDPNGFFSLFHL